MPAAVRLRDDFNAERLRVLARGSKDAPQARRLLALATIYDGGARSEGGKDWRVTLQIVRDWVLGVKRITLTTSSMARRRPAVAPER